MEVKIKEVKITKIGLSYYFLIPKQFIKNDVVKQNKKYEIIIQEKK